MKKRLLTGALTLGLLFTGVQGTAAAPQFKDVGTNHRAQAEIGYLAESGIISGYRNGHFGVNDEITRLQAAIMIVRALNLPMTAGTEHAFTDVKPGAPNYRTVATVAEAGIMLGNGNGAFEPEAPVTRAQMAAILVRAFELKGTTAYDFRDVPAGNWAAPSIKTLLVNQVTTGYPDNTFKPGAAITRSQFAMFMARVLDPAFRDGMACYKPDNDKETVVDVAVTTLWTDPGYVRSVDKPAVSDPVDLAKWTSSMSRSQKLGLLGKIDTQALYGEDVTVLEKRGSWVKVAVNAQSTPKNKAGYPGWVPAAHLTESYPNYEDCAIAVVDVNKASLYAAPGKPAMTVSFNTTLPVVKTETDWVTVAAPDGTMKLLRRADVKIYDDFEAIPQPTGAELVATGRQFLGLPYLWAGVSGFGFDCSGFTSAVYKHHGILIPRDASAQAKAGTAVAKSALQPGDLLFFAHNSGKGAVHHVSMYIGGGKMIHSPNYNRPLEIISVDAEPYKSEFSGARRYLK